MEERLKSFVVKFDIEKNNIKTTMKTQHISPQEAIGLLEMAKDQILDNVKQRRKNLFHAYKKD